MVRSLALPIVESWKERARELRLDAHAVYLVKDPRMPWYVKLLAALVVGYLFSPIDVIPDFIPVLGYMVVKGNNTFVLRDAKGDPVWN